MKKFVILFLLILFLPLIKVEGYYCSFSDIARLKKIASNINTSYDYEIKNNEAYFEITLVNLNEEMYLVDTSNNKTYNYSSNTIKLNNYKSGSTVKFNVYPINSDCADELLRTIVVVLPKYNSYYDDEICQGIEDYSLCQKWSTHNLSYTEFVKKINIYKESLKKDNPVIIQDEDDSSIFDLILQFLIKYYYIPLIVLIIGCGIGIYTLNKKSDIYK